MEITQPGGTGGGTALTVTDGITPVLNVSTISFTSGATVTSGGAGTANIAISGGAWGTITGTLSNQTDLQTALDAKQNDIVASDTQVIFSDGPNNPTGEAGFTYNKTTDTLTVAGVVASPIFQATTSAGLNLHSANGTDIAILGAGNTANVTWYGSHNYDLATANTIASFGASKTLSSLSTATYPSLTELAYVKGVTSAIQTQLDNKQPLDADLTTIAGLTATTDNFIVSVASAWASRTPTQVKTTLGLSNVTKRQMEFIIGNGTDVITTGAKPTADIRVPVGGTITGWEIVSIDAASPTSGSISIDIWKDTYANYPPTVADTITASAKPSVTTATKNTSTTLTGWTTTFNEGDHFWVNVDSVTSFKAVKLYVFYTVS